VHQLAKSHISLSLRGKEVLDRVPNSSQQALAASFLERNDFRHLVFAMSVWMAVGASQNSNLHRRIVLAGLLRMQLQKLGQLFSCGLSEFLTQVLRE